MASTNPRTPAKAGKDKDNPVASKQRSSSWRGFFNLSTFGLSPSQASKQAAQESAIVDENEPFVETPSHGPLRKKAATISYSNPPPQAIRRSMFDQPTIPTLSNTVPARHISMSSTVPIISEAMDEAIGHPIGNLDLLEPIGREEGDEPRRASSFATNTLEALKARSLPPGGVDTPVQPVTEMAEVENSDDNQLPWSVGQGSISLKSKGEATVSIAPQDLIEPAGEVSHIATTEQTDSGFLDKYVSFPPFESYPKQTKDGKWVSGNKSWGLMDRLKTKINEFKDENQSTNGSMGDRRSSFGGSFGGRPSSRGGSSTRGSTPAGRLSRMSRESLGLDATPTKNTRHRRSASAAEFLQQKIGLPKEADVLKTPTTESFVEQRNGLDAFPHLERQVSKLSIQSERNVNSYFPGTDEEFRAKQAAVAQGYQWTKNQEIKSAMKQPTEQSATSVTAGLLSTVPKMARGLAASIVTPFTSHLETDIADAATQSSKERRPPFFPKEKDASKQADDSDSSNENMSLTEFWKHLKNKKPEFYGSEPQGFTTTPSTKKKDDRPQLKKKVSFHDRKDKKEEPKKFNKYYSQYMHTAFSDAMKDVAPLMDELLEGQTFYPCPSEPYDRVLAYFKMVYGPLIARRWPVLYPYEIEQHMDEMWVRMDWGQFEEWAIMSLRNHGNPDYVQPDLFQHLSPTDPRKLTRVRLGRQMRGEEQPPSEYKGKGFDFR